MKKKPSARTPEPFVCYCSGGYPGGDPEEGLEIDFCPLHAAAPELLEALRRIGSNLNNWVNEEGGYEEALVKVQKVCEQAIAKAEGR